MSLRRSLAPLILFAATVAPAAIAQRSSSRDAVERVSAVVVKQRERPFWFVLHGSFLSKTTFLHQVTVSRTRQGNDGTDEPASTATSWCAAYVDGRNTGVYCRDTLADLPKSARPRRDRRESEAEKFWDEFRKAFVFEIRQALVRGGRPTTVVSFVPVPGYVSGRNDDTAIFPYIRGLLWIDDADLEIARFEYEFFEDSSVLVFGRILAGTRYSMDLEKQLGGIWLPSQAETESRLGVMSSSYHEKTSVRFHSYLE